MPAALHRVLIIDDEPAVLFAYRKMIEQVGMAVDICTCVSEASGLIATCDYLAAVIDIRLGGSENEDGLEVVKILKETSPGTRMILATGYGTSETRESARLLGAEHYFEKPVRPADILEVLKSFTSPPPNART